MIAAGRHLVSSGGADRQRGKSVPKQIKGNASRKPPEPSADHSGIDDWLERQMPHLRPIVQSLDESIRTTIPGLQYAVKWRRPYHGLPELGCTTIRAARVDRAGRPHAGLEMNAKGARQWPHR